MSNKDTSIVDGQLDRRLFMQSVGAVAVTAMVACKDDEAKAEAETPADGKKPEGGEDKPAASVQKLAKMDTFRKEHRLRYGMVELVHFADRSSEGLLAIDMGTLGARKYTNGGWRSGWHATIRKDGEVGYLEADSKTSRVFFKHSKGGYDRVLVQMKAVKKSNAVTFYVNDEAIKTLDVDGSWKDYIVEIPEKTTSEGENQVMMRFKYDTKEDGRTQAVHVSNVLLLPKGADPAAAPAGPAAETVTFAGLAQPALVARTPQTFTYRIDLPKNDPKLALTWGAAKAGATFKITAASDTAERHTLLEETVTAEQAGSWQESIIELERVGGAAAELELTVGGEFGEGQMAAFGDPGIWTPEYEDAAKPPTTGKPAKHVLVYLIDTVRFDKFDFYNRKTSAKTPNISAFAKDATIFDSAYDNENWTKPSTATILTGLYPETHNAKEDDSKLPADAVMISEHFKSNGFKTASFLANGYVSDAFGFKQGWDFYTNYIREKKETNADKVVKDTLEWINKNKDSGRLFTYVHTIDPHVPYSPPTKYREMYWNKEYTGPLKPNSTGEQLAEIKTRKLTLNDTDKKYLEALYDGETTFNDSAFGELVEGLKAMGLYEDTVIAIIADHGEEFWDHESVGHGHSLYEELIHTPLIVRYPGMVAAGRRVPHVVSMVDLAPTLFELTGIKGNDDLEGTSFVDTLDGTGNAHPRIAVSDFLYRKKAIRAGRYKWITIGRYGDLYDVVSDRHEKDNVLKKHSIARAFIRGQFGVFAGATDKSVWWKGADLAKQKKEFKADKASMDSDTQKMLEDLGYVEGAKGDVDAKSDKKKMEEEDN